MLILDDLDLDQYRTGATEHEGHNAQCYLSISSSNRDGMNFRS